MSWALEILNERVERELLSLPDDLQGKFLQIGDLLISHGPHKVREPYVKPLKNKLWEMRMKGRDGIARAIYVAAKGKRLVIVHAFVKKTQKTPRTAMTTALKRAKEAGLL